VAAVDSVPAVLVVEDEPALAQSVQYTLEQECFRVLIAGDGEQAVALSRSEQPALVLLDLMLPKLSGLDVCRLIRQDSSVPIMMLTARNAEADKVAGLELGADDYMTKPFSMRELVARVRAQIRRSGMPADQPQASEAEGLLNGGPVELDPSRHEARVNGSPVSFTPREFDLLTMFLERRGRLLTRDFLIAELWGHDYFGDSKTLDVHVRRVRQKIEPDPANPRYLVTVRGLGYRYLDDRGVAA
jgi:two-component system response regulator RegX3